MTKRNPHRGESGAAMVLVLTILTALLAGAAIALTLQQGSTKSSGLTASNKRALYCAESGLAAAKQFMLLNTSNWDAMLTAVTTDDPTGYPITGDIDGDGNADYIVTVRDDDDDINEEDDTNGRIFLVARCTKYSNFEAEILELIDVSGAQGVCSNRLQKGGCASKGGNFNVQ